MENKEMLEEKIKDEVQLEENGRSEEDRLIEELADSLIYELEEENHVETAEISGELQNPDNGESDAEVEDDREEETDSDEEDPGSNPAESNPPVNNLREYISSKYEKEEDREELIRGIDLLERSFSEGEDMESALEMIRRGINYERDMAVAMREGEIAGRNMKIEMELRRILERRVPYVAGGKVELREEKENSSIFDLARGAR